jgi:hypothetical protein
VGLALRWQHRQGLCILLGDMYCFLLHLTAFGCMRHVEFKSTLCSLCYPVFPTYGARCPSGTRLPAINLCSWSLRLLSCSCHTAMQDMFMTMRCAAVHMWKHH